MSDVATAAEEFSSPRGVDSNRGNRSSQHRSPSRSQNSTDKRGRGTGFRGPRGPRGGRGRGRGRGSLPGHGQNATSFATSLPPESTAEDSSGRPPGGGFGARLTGAASKPEGDSKDPQLQGYGAEAEADEVEVCFICASPIGHVSIAPCNHQTCHICSLRLRALYKTRACAHCRVRPSLPEYIQ